MRRTAIRVGMLVLAALMLTASPFAHAQAPGQWIQSANSYPTTIESQSCAASSGYVYCVGGATGSGETGAVYSAPMSGTTIGPWVQSSDSYPTSIEEESCAIDSGYIYCVGGVASGFTPTNTVYYAPVSGMTIGPWAASANAYGTTGKEESCAIDSGYMYCVGGAGGSLDQQLSDVYSAPVSGTTIGPWTISPDAYGAADTGQSCAVSSGYMYCVGGLSGGAVIDSGYYAPESGGAIGPWVQSSNNYPSAVDAESCVALSSYVYCVGGVTATGIVTPTSSVYYSAASGAAIGPWTQSAISFATDIAYEPCVAGSGRLYCIGGNSGSSTATVTSAVYYNQPPAVSLGTASGPAGASVAVTGAGFVGSQTVTMTFDGSSLAFSSGCTSGSAGTFSCSFTVPPSPLGDDFGNNVVVTDGTYSVSASFSVTTSIALSPTSGAVGTDVAVSGSGFSAGAAGVPISVSFNGAAVSTTGSCQVTGGAVPSSQGCSFAVPSGEAPGAHTVTGCDDINDCGSETFTVTASGLSLAPSQGPSGVATTLSGSGYTPSNSYYYCFESGVTSSPSACSSAHQFTSTGGGAVPASASLVASGTTGLVVVSDAASGVVVTSATFKVTTPSITLNPAGGAPGSAVSVTGAGFSVSTAIGVFTYQGSAPATQCTAQTTSSTGAFSCSFTVPLSSAAGADSVVASGSDVGTVSADSASATFSVAVSTTTSVTCFPPSVPTGSLTSCTATVSGSSPTGSVTFTTSSGSGAFTPANGQCALSFGSCSVYYADSSAGTPTITTSYGGDADNAASSGTLSLTVAAALPAGTAAFTLQCPPLTVVGMPSPCIAALTSPSGAAPQGTVTLASSSGSVLFVPSGSCTLVQLGPSSSSSCVATFIDTSVQASVTITASYTTSNGYTASPISQSSTLSVGKAGTTLVLTCASREVVMLGVSDSCTAAVYAASIVAPTGMVTFSASAGAVAFSPSASCSLSGSPPTDECAVSFTASSAALVTLSATYAGDQNDQGSGNVFVVGEGITASTTTVGACTSPQAGTLGSCTVTVTGSSPTGAVVFPPSPPSYSGLLYEPPGCVLATVDPTTSQCTMSFADETAERPTVTADYLGDANNGPSSGTASVTVTPFSPAVASVTVSGCTPASLSVTLGSTVTCTVTVSLPSTSSVVGQVFATGLTAGPGGLGFLASLMPRVQLCTVAFSGTSSGSCSITLAGVQPGTGTMTASFAGRSGQSGTITILPGTGSNTLGSGMADMTFMGGPLLFQSGLPPGASLLFTPPGSDSGFEFAGSFRLLGSPDTGVGSLSLGNPLYGDVSVIPTSGASTSGLLVTVCLPDGKADSSTILQYWDASASSWVSASNIVVTPGVKVCGDVPLSGLNGSNVGGGAPLSVPEFPSPDALPLLFSAVVAIYLFTRRRGAGLTGDGDASPHADKNAADRAHRGVSGENSNG